MPGTLLTIAQAAKISADAKKAGKTVVTVNGVFDMLSLPHVRMIQAAKNEGDVLLVGLNSDACVRALKGNKRPIVPEAERAAIAAAIAGVDGVFLFDDADPRAWLKQIQPNVHVNSAEYGKECIEAETVKTIGARLVLTQRDTEHLSTSDVIAVIQKRYATEQ